MITDFVAFRESTLENFWVLVGSLADDEEDGGRLFLFEYVEDFGSPARIRAIIERE